MKKARQELRSEKTANEFLNTARTFSKKVTAVTGVTEKAVYIKIIVTAVTSVTRKSETCYLITAPTFTILNTAPTYESERKELIKLIQHGSGKRGRLSVKKRAQQKTAMIDKTAWLQKDKLSKI